MIGTDLPTLALKSAYYKSLIGTTPTGFPQPYRDFWFFGAAIFFFVTQFMGRQFAKAHSGSLQSLCLYAVLLPLALLAITHNGYYVLIYAPLPVFALWLAFRWAKPPASRRPSIFAPPSATVRPYISTKSV